jgi:GT2 family glycosyltransferase
MVADISPATVAIMILSYNQRQKTLQCLARLRETGELKHQVLVWDNGSSDGTVEAVREAFTVVLAHRHHVNLGVGSGRNAAAQLAIERFEPTHLLFLDNDIMVEPGFVEALLEPLLRDPQVGQAQAKLRFLNDPERLNDGGGARITFWLGRVRPVGYGELDRGQHDRVAPCVSCGGAMLVRADIFRQLAGFNKAFDPFGPEDLDFSLRLQKAGYQALYVPQAVGLHEVSHTFEPGGYSEKYARHKARHWFIFMRRHATPLQKAGFYLVGAPYLAARIIIREGRKGNFGALRGIFRGILDFWKPSTDAQQRSRSNR